MVWILRKIINLISLDYQGLIRVRFGESINFFCIGISLIWLVSTAKTERLYFKARFTYEDSPKKGYLHKFKEVKNDSLLLSINSKLLKKEVNQSLLRGF